MQKKGKDRGRSWYSNIPWILLFIFACLSLYWLLYRGPTYTTLKYGEFIQLLHAARHDPSISLQNVRVSADDIQGDAVFNDSVSDGKQNTRTPQTVTIRTLRVGLENDQELHTLLRQAAGPNYEGHAEESFFKTVLPQFMPLLLIAGLAATLVFLFRWLGGDGSPLTFGRSKAKLYAQKDMAITFQRRGRHRRGGGRTARGGRFPQDAGEISGAGRSHSQGRAAGRPARHRQDAAGQGGGRRGRCAVLQPEWQRFRRDVRRRRRGARARSLRPGRDARPLASSSSTSSTLSAKRAPAPRSAATTSASRRSTSCSSRWTASSRIAASSSWPRPTAPKRSTPLCCVRAVSTDTSWSIGPTSLGREAILKVHVRNVKLGPDVDLRRVASLTPGSVRRRPGEPRQRGGADGGARRQGSGRHGRTSTRPSNAVPSAWSARAAS